MQEQTEIQVVGVDIGGSHLAAGEVMLGTKCVRPGTTRRIGVDSKASSSCILNEWGSCLANFVNEHNRHSVRIGIAMPGPFDYENGISYIKELNKYDALYGIDVKSWLADYLKISAANILFRNDAEAFLHGEVVYRGGSASEKVVGITLGTGLGSAVSEKGTTYDVFRAIRPMHDGIAEDYISSRWFSKKYRELSGGVPLDSVEALAKGDDSFKDRLFEEFAINLAAFLDEFVQEEGASTIIIGGNIAKCLDLFVDKLQSNMTNKGVIIEQAKLWEEAALFGAAYLWSEEISEIGVLQKKEIKIC